MINNGKIVSWLYLAGILGCIGYIVKEKLDYINELEQTVIEQDRAIKMLRLERELINIRHQITPGTSDLPIYQ